MTGKLALSSRSDDLGITIYQLEKGIPKQFLQYLKRCMSD